MVILCQSRPKKFKRLVDERTLLAVDPPPQFLCSFSFSDSIFSYWYIHGSEKSEFFTVCDRSEASFRMVMKLNKGGSRILLIMTNGSSSGDCRWFLSHLVASWEGSEVTNPSKRSLLWCLISDDMCASHYLTVVRPPEAANQTLGWIFVLWLSRNLRWRWICFSRIAITLDMFLVVPKVSLLRLRVTKF